MTKPQVLKSLLEITDRYQGVLLDAYGVFWAGNDFGVIPGSKQAMEHLVSQGKVVGVLSNSTQAAAKEIEKLHRSGIEQDRHFHFLLTSGEVARQELLHQRLPFPTPRNTYWLWGGPHPRFGSSAGLFLDTLYTEASDLEAADFIYISVPHIDGEDQTNPELFRDRVEQCKKYNLPMVCANPDRYAHEGNPPRAVVRQGSIAMLYEEIGGEVYYIGKPSSLVYEKAMELFCKRNIEAPARVLMVGDTPETDIRGARRFGMASALLTATGIMAERVCRQGFDEAIAAIAPDDYPDFLVQSL